MDRREGSAEAIAIVHWSIIAVAFQRMVPPMELILCLIQSEDAVWQSFVEAYF